MQLYIKVPQLRRGKLKHKKVQNIGKVKGVFCFKVEQRYTFQVAPMLDNEESMTVITMTIPASTPVQQGYAEIRASLVKLGYDPYVVCTAMGFDEIVYNVLRESTWP